MSTLLATLRQNACPPDPARFLAQHPGCWIQFYDDTPAKDSVLALSVPTFNVELARRKQQERCAVCFSLQAFQGTRTKESLVSFRNLGVDVDLIAPNERHMVLDSEIEGRKEDYLRQCLGTFPLKPHWVVETRHGFHVIFRVQPVNQETGLVEAEAISRQLVRWLRGDKRACLLTQVLRVPGTLQFKEPSQPFLCRLLMDNALAIRPYDLDTVRRTLDRLSAPSCSAAPASPSQVFGARCGTKRWRDGLGGVLEGDRNVTAASLVGRILCHMPEELWETAGWGGLKEWNQRNSVPLPDTELRAVFESIARRENARRRHNSGTPSMSHSDSAYSVRAC